MPSTQAATPATAAAPLTSSVADGFAGAVGHTPLIRLRRASEATGCEILGKAEFMQPGGSVKDRAALGIIQAAEARGALV
ncbi:MAG: pyridoxal-phosphate dependent enzyme, partial [Acetobacteraceae bacterium]|nr:pyridoxal-phosphate dependent enzyme [Acetobacteraceae bacterium]